MKKPDEKYVAPPPARWMRGRVVAAAAESGQSPSDKSLPCYLTLPPVEDGPTRDRLDRLVDLARGGMGWKEALAATQDPALLPYVGDLRRALFLDLLPLTAESDILEIGPGLGQFTATLARRVRHVHAMEVVPQQAEFTLLRTRQEGVANVSVAVGGDDCRLPYRDASFDGIVINLVFEWCGSRIDSESHEQAQTRLLQEMARVLRPGGFLYLATKNRFALRLLLGGADEHMSNMAFGSSLPRRLAGWLLRCKGEARPMGKLYSHNTLLAMLQHVGLSNARSFWAVPEMRSPTVYIPSDPASVRAARARMELRHGDGRKTNAVMRFVPANWVRHVTPGLSFLAFKDHSRP